MKRTEYCLVNEISHKPPNGGLDEVKFIKGTIVFPFWNETLLPKHIKVEFENTKKLMQPPWQIKSNKPEDKLIMCVIGTYWIALYRREIREK